ncbi:MAG TPA: hypothetical protein DIU15_15535 [Deltaproteobacteria bacterium]|nr:hypothetical protein [Deltaproteobacteria bacterium]
MSEPQGPWDLVLSSGFLAFARHCGFLAGVEQHRLPVDGVCGTSSGALVGALWAAGYPAEAIAERLSADRPLAIMRPPLAPWRGLFSLGGLITRLRDWLPSDFAGLERPFGVGVMGPDRCSTLLTEGPLPEAIAASCAVPGLFGPVRIGGTWYRDGGVVDRIGLQVWRSYRGERNFVVHQVERSAGKDTPVPVDVAVVRTPRSGASLWTLGDFQLQCDEARALTQPVLAAITP